MAQWSIPIVRVADQAKADMAQAARQITLNLFNAVKLRAPVETGRFRANFNVSYGAIDTTVTASTEAGRMDVEIAKVNTLPVGGIMYLCNSLPYAQALEYGLYPNPPKNPTGKTVGGYSKQAPAGMVRLTAREFDEHVRKALA
jgi:hypothetical protein